MAPRKKALLVFLVAAGVAAVVVTVMLHGGDEPVPPASGTREAEIPADVIAERGPRPDVSRLPQGVRQLEDPGEALAVARDALRRVEAELAAAPAEGPERERLLRKKALIEASIERLGR
jgi:hypothetical protein